MDGLKVFSNQFSLRLKMCIFKKHKKMNTKSENRRN